MSLYDGGLYTGSVQSRALALLDATAAPIRLPVSVTFNALSRPDLVGILDITDRITVTRKGVTYPCRVVGIAHQLEPKKWFVTLQLARETTSA